MNTVNLEPNLWIIFKKTLDDFDRKIIKIWGITSDKLEVADLSDKGWICVRHGRDWESMEVLV